MEYKLSEQGLKDLMHRTWLKAKKFYSGKEDEYFYDYFESEKKQLTIHSVVVNEACKCDRPLPYELMTFKCHTCKGEIPKSEIELCECGFNERFAMDCTSKKCEHPKYRK